MLSAPRARTTLALPQRGSRVGPARGRERGDGNSAARASLEHRRGRRFGIRKQPTGTETRSDDEQEGASGQSRQQEATSRARACGEAGGRGRPTSVEQPRIAERVPARRSRPGSAPSTRIEASVRARGLSVAEARRRGRAETQRCRLRVAIERRRRRPARTTRATRRSTSTATSSTGRTRTRARRLRRHEERDPRMVLKLTPEVARGAARSCRST